MPAMDCTIWASSSKWSSLSSAQWNLWSKSQLSTSTWMSSLLKNALLKSISTWWDLSPSFALTTSTSSTVTRRAAWQPWWFTCGRRLRMRLKLGQRKSWRNTTSLRRSSRSAWRNWWGSTRKAASPTRTRAWLIDFNYILIFLILLHQTIIMLGTTQLPNSFDSLKNRVVEDLQKGKYISKILSSSIRIDKINSK